MSGAAVSNLKSVYFPKAVMEPMLRALVQSDVGIDFEMVLTHFGITEAQFHQSSFSLDGQQILDFHLWLKDKTRGRISIKQWAQFASSTSLGLAGMAALSARNVRDAAMIAVKYGALYIPVMDARLVEGKDLSRLEFEIKTESSSLNRFLLELVMGGFNHITYEVAEAFTRTVHFKHQFSDSEHGRARRKEVEDLFGVKEHGTEIVFNSYFNGIEAPTRCLDFSTQHPNEATYGTVTKMLDHEVDRNNADIRFSIKVTDELMRMAEEEKFPTLEHFADTVNMSASSLVRKLKSEGTSFKSVSNDVLLRRAKEFLKRSKLSVKQIAVKTGFTNTNSFSRAFKALTGKTPLAYRNEKQSEKQKSEKQNEKKSD